MFNSSSASVYLSIDPTPKPFYVAGDVLSGSIRLICDQKANFTGIDLRLRCIERAEVATETRNRCQNKAKPPSSAGRTSAQKIDHLNIYNTVLEGPKSSTFSLEKGEHVFPFVFEIPAEVDACPPSAPVKSSHGLEVGVRWKLKVIVRTASKLQANKKLSREITVFSHPKDTALLASPKQTVRELCGEDLTLGKSGLFTSSQKGTRLMVKLNYPSPYIPQRPHTIPLVLTANSFRELCQITSVSVNLLRCCEVNVGGKVDVYKNSIHIGTTNALQIVRGEADLSSLLTGMVLPELMPRSFVSTLVKVWYELELQVAYVFPESSKKPSSRTLKISTDVDLEPIYGVAESVQPIRGKELPVADDKARSMSTGFTHSTGFSLASSNGTMNSYDIVRPHEALAHFVQQWNQR